jgi:hypothetical protein
MEHNIKLRLKEEQNRKFFMDDALQLPYPHLDDSQFQKKISMKKEFLFKYDGEIKDVKEYSNIVCKKNKSFELSSHQEFIKRFISYNTPYNGILLFHGLGSGKTCSAIGITEAYRSYSKYIHNFKKIIIIASPNVQENFKLQLFDPSKLTNINNNWSMNGCLGNSLLDELNAYQINSLNKEEIITKIQKLITNYYEFTGYIEFANKIQKCITMKEGGINDLLTEKKLRAEFQDTLIVIDEVHNIRINSDVKNDKKVAKSLFQLVSYVKYLKLIFLTGTPMYNDPKEILFILNILNINDNRSKIGTKEIFDADNNFVVKDGKEFGKELFITKANGYISYVRGENPYSFPYLVTPKMYKDVRSSQVIGTYPRKQFNNKNIDTPIKYLDLYVSPLNYLQKQGYNYFLNKVLEKIREQENFEDMDSFRYSIIQSPINALNVIYPIEDTFLTGNDGLKSVMKFSEKLNPPCKNNFEYKRLNDMFSYNKIANYSHKIKTILDNIINSEGIVLIYSGYIDGGLVPMALALEHIGFTRYGAKSKTLFKNKPYLNDKDAPMKGYTYAIISGEKTLSPNNNEEIEALTHNNTNGERIKVVMISQAGSEGIDLKNIRQVHIMEPWYNMNRIEQIIGRARRNCSHMDLPLEKRNVQVFLHVSNMIKNSEEDEDNEDITNIETMDMYLYRLSEKKSINIGKITRIIKSVAVDCLLNKEQQSFSKINQTIDLTLSNNNKIKYLINDEPHTSLCDYNDTCEYECINKISSETENNESYSYQFTKNNKIKEKIKNLFKIKHVYKKKEIFSNIKTKNVNNEEIERSLHDLEQDTLVDMFGRKGTLINILDLYYFHPIEIKDEHASMHEILTPIQYKEKMFKLEPTKQVLQKVSKNTNEVIKSMYENYKLALTYNDDLRNDDNWYSFFNLSAEYLRTNLSISEEELNNMLIEHLCEELNYDNEIILLNEVFNKDGELERLIQKYYEQFIINIDGIPGIILLNLKSKDSIENVFIYDNQIWREATYTERKEYLLRYNTKMIDKKKQYKIVGFMGLNKSSNIYEFKIKYTQDTKSTGAVVENKSKPQIIQILNDTIGNSAFNIKKDKLKKKNELCVIEELILRYYNNHNTKNAKTFLNKLENYYLNKN